MNRHYQMLSLLLQYPEAELVGALREIEAVLAQRPAWRERLQPLLAWLGTTPLIELQQDYVATFDRNPGHSLHLFEHVHGESRDRGQAMVDLIEEYRRHGLDMACDELPDYVPLFLEFLGQLPDQDAARLLGDAVDVLAHLGSKLSASGSPYGVALVLLVEVSPVAPRPLTEPPVRDMDEALETFGPGADGAEPLLNSANARAGLPGGVQPINFHPKKPAPHAVPQA
ncbi:nitrate reductase molybdenum cofactor assembly chaperone [Pseudoduganella albidiflava]|uniref:Nitrate reductase molybdenum cofactor assembly chaperone n=1 Tax=Pseudoduganella albidiflava TaxID=321983 RepID=A0A411WXS2_9BURK|nr:nitrate reductase molybdenum cofactor assembly chaperone [Pseudoduganella albidiflava]QBI01499.1 nitrate reductase molybdenum cofactor assembly chaperone [Pseudoduganella albidiflava]GGY35279.1 respiratory nitrate reductase subunit delta [Pseudoduganella albidiflava]